MTGHEYINMPSTNAMLYIEGRPVTGNHRQHLRDAYHSIPLNELYRKKYGWSVNDTNNIWWTIHGKAMSCFTLDEQTTLNKYIHRRLPCNHRENIYYPYHDPLCQNCKEEIETQDHILRCNANEERNKIKKKYLRDLHITLVNNNTDNIVRRIIMECTYAWLNNQDLPALENITDDITEELRYAYNSQLILGWDHFVRGRLTNRWAQIFEDSNPINMKERIVKPDKWGKDTLVLTWKFVLNMWQHRNTIEHSTNDKEQAHARKRTKLIGKIKWLYTKNKGKLKEYEEINEEELEKLPTSNLMMMETQFSLQKKSNNNYIDLQNGDQGDSQP
jgi:hypothetical protein